MVDWKEQLFKQTTLYGIFKASCKYIEPSKFNERMWAFVFMLLYTCVIVNISCNACVMPHSSALKIVLSLGEVIFSYTTSILGFLIAGFAIFTSITKPIIFIHLAKIPHDSDGQINKLQFVFFNFITAFINFLGLMIFSFAIILLERLIDNLNVEFLSIFKNNLFLTTITYLLFLSYITWVASSFLKLKSFISNSYQAIVLAITVEESAKTKKYMRKARERTSPSRRS